MSTVTGVLFVVGYAAILTAIIWADLPRRWVRRRWAKHSATGDWTPLVDKYGSEPVEKIAGRLARVGEVLPTNGGGLTMWNGFDWVPVPEVNHDDKVTKE